jgi:hypothetical protein
MTVIIISHHNRAVGLIYTDSDTITTSNRDDDNDDNVNGVEDDDDSNNNPIICNINSLLLANVLPKQYNDDHDNI